MRPEIENLKAWIYGKSTTGYQRALGMREFEKLLEYISELEQLRQPLVSGELNCEHDWLVDMYDHFGFPASRFCDKCNTCEAI